MKIEYTEQGMDVYRELTNIDKYGHLTLDGFKKRLEYTVEHNDYIMSDPSIQQMIPMVSPHLLLYTDGEIFPISKMVAMCVRPAIVHEAAICSDFWLEIPNDMMTHAINQSSILEDWLAEVDFQRWKRLSARDDYTGCEHVAELEVNLASKSFAQYAIMRSYSGRTSIPCANVQKHVYAKHKTVAPLISKYNQKDIPSGELFDIDRSIENLNDLFKVAKNHQVRWNRKHGSYMDDQDCFYHVYSVSVNYFCDLVGSELGQRIHDELYHRHFMVNGDNQIVLGWVRYQYDEDRGIMMINEIQSRLRHKGWFQESNIDASQWKRIEDSILNNFLIVSDFFFGAKTVYLPTAKFIQENSEGTPGEVYHRFPKQIGFKKVIADNIGQQINGQKCWKLDLDFDTMANK